MITQLISFFLPQNAPSSQAQSINGTRPLEGLSFNIAQDHRQMNVRVNKIAFLSMQEQKSSSGVP